MESMTVVQRQIASTLRDVASGTDADIELVERLIHTARAAAGTQPGGAGRRPRRHRVVWIKPLLAAALVAAIAGCAAILLNLPRHQMPPSTATTTAPPTPTPSGSASTSAAVPVANGPFRPWTCTVPSPDRWAAAWSRFIRPPGAAPTDLTHGLSILDMSSTGAVLAFSTATPPGQSHGEVVLVRPDQSTRVLYRLPTTLAGQNTLRVTAGQLDTQWAVFAVTLGGGQGTVGAIDAVNLSTGTGTVHVIRDASLGTLLQVSAPQLLNGHVYWSELSNTGHGSVYDADLATGTRTTLDSGDVIDPQIVGGAVEWGRNRTVVWHGTPTLPPGLQITPGKTVTLLRDGATFAWTQWTGTGTDQKQVLYMAKLGAAKPKAVYTPPTPDVIPQLLALSGPYVIFDDTSITALDTRTGAATTIVTGSQPGSTTAAAAGGVIALNQIGAKGGTQLALAHTTDLPELRC